MGSASTKFRKYLQNGDEYAAMQIFQSNPDLQRSLDPNMSYGDAYHHNTPLHFTAKHAMKHLLRTFLNDLGGNPNKKNAHNENSLHSVCQVLQSKSLSAQERRSACIILILQWRGPQLANGELEKADIAALDEKKNTALHYASISGLKKCVELLVAHGAPLFVENEEKQTPCDCAEKAGHEDIALYLESKMVFADSSDTINEADLVVGLDLQEAYKGLRSQDLQEAKDQLLVETSDMLHVPLFTAEALLRDNEWSRETLLENWMKDPISCCEKAGVQPPTSALQFAIQNGEQTNITAETVTLEYQEETLNSPIRTTPLDTKTSCDICAMAMAEYEESIPAACDHLFCRSCWERYLTVKIQAGDAHITCPAFGCSRLVPVDIIEKLVSPDMIRRYLQFDIKAFVESNPSIKWCPYPGCGRAVRLPESEIILPEILVPNTVPPLPTSHAVDCGNGHFFCWECLGEAHAPSCCNRWKEWHQKIAEVKPEELKSTFVETEDAANCLWLVTNSKPCPNCKSPIQKNEGCNHMKCSKCKFDFCWVCLEAWNKHSSATGGYFRCNRYEAVHRAEERHGVLISVAELRNKQMQELNRFVHYYTRFRNHENSHKMEEPLLKVAKDKMLLLATSMSDLACNSPEAETKFIEDAVGELLKSRRVLCGSYVYGYYLEDNGYNKTIFELMQNELEECTEKLAQMVARPYLRTPRAKIIQVTTLVKRKRQEFVIAVSKGLIPPETPPTMRKLRRRRFPSLMGMDPVEDEQLTQAIAASLRDLDPNNPWVKDSQGRHTNLAAIYDWPDYDSDEDAEMNQALAASILGVCSRRNCNKLRARNPRTGAMHEYCSLRCSKAAKAQDTEDPVPAYTSDYQMELLIALEMSRLQMIQDMERQQQQQQQQQQPDTMENNQDISEASGPFPQSPSTCHLHIGQQPLPTTFLFCDNDHHSESAIEGGKEETLQETDESHTLDFKEATEDSKTEDEDVEAGLTGTSTDSPLPPFLTPSSDLSVTYFLKETDDVMGYLHNTNIEGEMGSKADKQLLFKSSSTGSLDHPQERTGRLTASTGNLVTSAAADEWDRDVVLQLLRQQSDGIGTSTTSLALSHDSTDLPDPGGRLVASTSNLIHSSHFNTRLVASALDLPERVHDTSCSVYSSRDPWGNIFSHFSSLRKANRFNHLFVRPCKWNQPL